MSNKNSGSEQNEHDLESKESSDEDDDVEDEDSENGDRNKEIIDWKLLDNQKSVAPDMHLLMTTFVICWLLKSTNILNK